MKIGRNKPCPCGSGKKYKKCCLNQENVSSDLLYRRLGEAHNRLVHRLMEFGFKVFGESALGVALDEFTGWLDEGPSEDDLEAHGPLFYPWFIFNWEYEADPDLPQLEGLEDLTIAELYAADRLKRLNPLEAQIIEATARKPYRFYEIEEVRPGEGYRLKDIFCGTVSNVIEKRGSENARRGQILFGRVVQIETVAMLIGCGTVLIPPKMKPELIRFRKWLLKANDRIDSDTLYDYDTEIRDLYFEIYNAVLQPPKLQNTDGDAFQFHTIFYEIDTPWLVFERLKDLSAVDSETDLLQAADLDDSGRVVRVEIPWSRKNSGKKAVMENTLLGRLLIDVQRLKIEVNSASRAQKIRQEIEKRLGKRARYITTEIQSPEAMLKSIREQEDDFPVPDAGNDELMQVPEVRAQIEKMLSSHWENWVDQEIPALGHMTPQQAVKTPDGRESVEALLLDAEMHLDTQEHMRDAGAGAIAEVRRRLGLDKPGSATAVPDADKKSERIVEIKHKIEAFGHSRLDPEHTGLALKLCEKIGRMRKLSIQRGRPEIWAAAIVHVIARLNFLFDPENEVCISTDELNEFFETNKSTVGNKAGMILKSANLHPGDPNFSSAKIAHMFSFYETEEGFILPASFFDSLDHAGGDDGITPAPLMNPSDRPKQRTPKADRKKASPAEKKKTADDRQLKLFDDEP